MGDKEMKAVFTTISILALTASTSAFAPATNAFSRQSSISTAIFSEVATPEINELDFENVDLVRALGSRRLKGMLRTMKREKKKKRKRLRRKEWQRKLDMKQEWWQEVENEEMEHKYQTYYCRKLIGGTIYQLHMLSR